MGFFGQTGSPPNSLVRPTNMFCQNFCCSNTPTSVEYSRESYLITEWTQASEHNSMSGFLNKWCNLLRRAFRQKYEAACVAMGVVYLVAALGISANHSCEVSKTDFRHSHFGNPDHHSSGKPWTDPQFGVALHQDDGQPKPWHSQAQCMACLYSIVAKSVQPRTSSRLINPGVVPSFHILPLTRIAKQSEWLSYISLRAPPITAS